MWQGYAENLLAVEVLLKLLLTKGLGGELLGESVFICTATAPKLFQRK